MVNISQLLTLTLFVSTALGQDWLSSVPEPGQFHRYRALPRGSNLAVAPVDGAEFLAKQKFDISVELHNTANLVSPDLKNTLSFLVNGKDASQVLNDVSAPHFVSYNASYFQNAAARDSSSSTRFAVTKATWRGVSLPASGTYTVEIKAANETIKATWTVRGSAVRKAKNVLLFVGDGMAPSMIAAARYAAHRTRFGKFENADGWLHMEKLGSIGKIATNGLESIMTDSANSAAAYTSGHKSWANALNVYADTTSNDQLDDPKVEAITEIIRRQRPGMCIGVVSTAEIHDATPAAMYAHTRSRSQGPIIIDQMLNGFTYYKENNGTWIENKDEKMNWGPAVKPDVVLGGGGNDFCAGGKTCESLNGKDQYKAFADAGYTVLHDKTALNAYTDSSKPLLGIFTSGNMDTWIDRVPLAANLQSGKSSPFGDEKPALDQPGLEEMTMKAIEIMDKRCSDGWFLMSEAASVDKAMHPMDYDRGIADLLELDRTVKRVVDYNKEKKNTAIFLTADHSQAFDVYGSVDMDYFRAQPDSDVEPGSSFTPYDNGDHKLLKRQAIGIYGDAGWTDVVVDAQGLPTQMANSKYRFASGKVDRPPTVDDFEFKRFYRSPTRSINDVEGAGSGNKYYPARLARFNVANPSDAPNGGLNYHGGNLPALGDRSSVHSLQTVDLYCAGPVAHTCAKVMDNTELFFLMADALGLGDQEDEGTYTPPGQPDTTCQVPGYGNQGSGGNGGQTGGPNGGNYGSNGGVKGGPKGNSTVGVSGAAVSPSPAFALMTVVAFALAMLF
ncbi:hypothetical protein HDV05_007884 [Chytridiales sp. JEL 0842]|nr:hypothetical protein HDV05_007884 [Chytridiales sp. JEL 0842]